MGAHQNFIAGEWVDGSSVTRNVNPSNTNDVVGEYAQADAAQTNAAIEAAHVAFPAWSRTTPQGCCTGLAESSPIMAASSTSF